MKLLTDLLFIFQSVKELERIGQVSEFNPRDSLHVERYFQIFENENEENTAPPEIPAASGIPDVEESIEKPIEKVKGKKKKKSEKYKPESPNKDDDELSEEYLDKQIPRRKKAIKIKLKNALIELHEKNKNISKVRLILDRHLERIEEKEKVIEGKDFAIESFHQKVKVITQRIEEKESELREKDRLLREAEENAELLKKQLAEQEKIVTEMRSRQSALRVDLHTRVEPGSLKRENERFKLQMQQKNSTLKEREQEIDSLKREKELYSKRNERVIRSALKEKK